MISWFNLKPYRFIGFKLCLSLWLIGLRGIRKRLQMFLARHVYNTPLRAGSQDILQTLLLSGNVSQKRLEKLP